MFLTITILTAIFVAGTPASAKGIFQFGVTASVSDSIQSYSRTVFNLLTQSAFVLVLQIGFLLTIGVSVSAVHPRLFALSLAYSSAAPIISVTFGILGYLLGRRGAKSVQANFTGLVPGVAPGARNLDVTIQWKSDTELGSRIGHFLDQLTVAGVVGGLLVALIWYFEVVRK